MEKDAFCAQRSCVVVCKGRFRFLVYWLFFVFSGGKVLKDSLVNNDTIETEELNEKAGKVEKPEDAADIINEYEEILLTKRKGIITVMYHQGKVFSQFREKEKFIALVSTFGVRKSTLILKIKVFKLMQHYLKLIKTSVSLRFMKNYFKDIKQICQKNLREFV